ncbi:MAG: hypothetical protein RR700_07465 [Anaerorhabdus sp.]|uniref:hypothetical protein n=1 Tax=Anaerorhabdus sp. TaxID=1872524 RepID=UPI002FC591AC
MKKIRNILLVLFGIFLFSIPFIWSLFIHGQIFVNYNHKGDITFDNQNISIGARCNNFQFSYDGHKVNNQDYLISKDGKQLLLIIPLEGNVVSESFAKVFPITEISFNEENEVACKDMNFGVYILDRTTNYSFESKDETGSVFINGQQFPLNENQVQKLMTEVEKWSESVENYAFDDTNKDLGYLSITSSKRVIDTTRGNILLKEINIHFYEKDDFVYIEASFANYNDNNIPYKRYILDKNSFNNFIELVNESVINNS